MFEISAKKGLCYVIWGSEVKTSDLAAHFSRNSGVTGRRFVNTRFVWEKVRKQRFISKGS